MYSGGYNTRYSSVWIEITATVGMRWWRSMLTHQQHYWNNDLCCASPACQMGHLRHRKHGTVKLSEVTVFDSKRVAKRRVMALHNEFNAVIAWWRDIWFVRYMDMISLIYDTVQCVLQWVVHVCSEGESERRRRQQLVNLSQGRIDDRRALRLPPF